MTRTEIAEPRFGGDRQFEVPCDCVGRCNILFISEWSNGDGEPGEQYFAFYSGHREDTWRQRVRSAWLTLRGKGGYYHCICSTPQQGRQLGEWLLAQTEGRESDGD